VSNTSLAKTEMSVVMNTCRVLVLSLFAASCAATAEPVPVSPSALDSIDAPVVDPEAGEVPDPIQGFAFSVPLPLVGTTVANASEDTAAPPPAPKSPHSFSGGVGIRFRDGESAITLMGQYHYYVNPKLDVGALVDWAASPINSLLIAPAAWWRPTERLTLFGAPGVEFLSGKGGKAALRLGGSYSIVVGKMVIRPFGWYDLVADRPSSFAFGVAAGM
jgi:hypothetical protein